MTAHEIPSTLADLLIVGAVVFYNKIYGVLLLAITHEELRAILIDLKDIFGVLVGILGSVLMWYKIVKVRKQMKEIKDME